MRRILGSVVVKETGIGVPNVEVSAYDSQCDEPLSAQGRLEEIARLLTRRIASVLTNPAGQFVLSIDDPKFAGSDQRVNLVLAVFASEDVRDVEHPHPLSPEQRLIYVSSKPRVDSGVEEAYAIRILQAQVEKFSIPLSAATQQGTADGTRYADRVKHTLAFREGIKNDLKTHVQAQIEAAAKRRKAAQIFTKHLSAIPRHLRDDRKTGKKNTLQNNDLLISQKANLPAKLAPLQHKSVEDGLGRLTTAKRKPLLRLHLSPTDFASLGLTYEDGKVTGTVSPKALAKLLALNAPGAGLKKVRGIDNPSVDELARRYLGTGTAHSVPAAIPEEPERPHTAPAETARQRKARAKGTK
jgi:hypothetical protein